MGVFQFDFALKEQDAITERLGLGPENCTRMGLQQTIFNTLFKFKPVYVLGTVGTIFMYELASGPIDAVWYKQNEGKLWRDMKDKYDAKEAEKAPNYRVIQD